MNLERELDALFDESGRFIGGIGEDKGLDPLELDSLFNEELFVVADKGREEVPEGTDQALEQALLQEIPREEHPMPRIGSYEEARIPRDMTYQDTPLREGVVRQESSMPRDMAYQDSPLREGVVRQESSMPRDMTYQDTPLREEVPQCASYGMAVSQVTTTYELLREIMHYSPFNIDSRKQVELINIEYGVVIEKISNRYMVLLIGFMKQPMYLLENEDVYFEFEGPVEAFVGRIKKRICRMCGLSEAHFDRLPKLLINDGTVGRGMQGVERLKIIGRENLIRQLAYKEHKMVIDLTEEACIIACRDENNNIMRITSEGLGLKKGPWVRETVQRLVGGLQCGNQVFIGKLEELEGGMESLAKHLFK